MKIEIPANELMRDPCCANCGKLLTGVDVVVLFQDDQGHDLRDGYYCEKCSEKYSEDGIAAVEIIRKNANYTDSYCEMCDSGIDAIDADAFWARYHRQCGEDL